MKLICLILGVYLMGCGTSTIHSIDSTTILGTEETSEDALYEHLREACEHLPAYRTRSVLGNRPIVIDGISFYCF